MPTRLREHPWLASHCFELVERNGIDFEQDVADARDMGMRFSRSVMTRLMVWMCEACLRVTDYDKQAEYFTSAVVGIFGLDEITASDIALYGLESTLSRLISALTAASFENDSAEVTSLMQCLKSYIRRGDDLLPWPRIGHIIPIIDTLVCAHDSEVNYLTRTVAVLAPLEDQQVDDTEDKEIAEFRATFEIEPLAKAIGETNEAHEIVVDICPFSSINENAYETHAKQVLTETSGVVALLDFGRRISAKRKQECEDVTIIADFYTKAEQVENVDPMTPLSDNELTILETAHEAMENICAIRSAGNFF